VSFSSNSELWSLLTDWPSQCSASVTCRCPAVPVVPCFQVVQMMGVVIELVHCLEFSRHLLVIWFHLFQFERLLVASR
jgi:hypothetical protein